MSISDSERPKFDRSRSVASIQTTPESESAHRFADAWREGACASVEEFLSSLPAGAVAPQVAVRIIFEEMCLRQDDGQEVHSDEYLRRFPQYRSELQLLLECQGLLDVREPQFPKIGQTYGEFEIVEEIGRGGQGRVYLAVQPDLADRQVVLKASAQHGSEHLSLARVQHTNIVPLYFARDDHERNLRVFCMPYLGRMTLAHLIWSQRNTPMQERSGKAALAFLEKSGPTSGRRATSCRAFLERATYVEAVCWFGAALADALHYVHERGLVHLDVKPSNVLLTADGQPMLLDFHLAREPVKQGEPPPDWFGGTRDYMAPEQAAVMDAVRRCEEAPIAVDARADVFALGLVLYESLSGVRPPVDALPPPLWKTVPGVSMGLSDLLERCLAPAPEDRYRTAAELAVDLRLHLTDQPLAGAPNRSLAERYRKWRKRRPAALAVYSLLGLVLGASAAAGAVGWRHFHTQASAAEEARASGERLAMDGRFHEAADEFARGRRLAEATFGGGDLAAALESLQEAALQRGQVEALEALVDRLRFVYTQESLPADARRKLDAGCGRAWEVRGRLLAVVAHDPALTETVRTDLLDLAVLWSHLVRGGGPQEGPRADSILHEAERALGSGDVLGMERDLQNAVAGGARPAGAPSQAAATARLAAAAESADALKTAWEYVAVGRALVRVRQLGAASRAFQKAVDRAPHDFWVNFWQADCAWRKGDSNEALDALRVCIALAPDRAQCYYNRGVILAALQRTDAALRDFDRALALEPDLAPALFERGKLRGLQGKLDLAAADLEHAIYAGAPAAATHVELARIHLARKDRAAASRAVQSALRANPAFAPALELSARLARPEG